MERAERSRGGKWAEAGISGAALKRIAVISMLADHFALVFLQNGVLFGLDQGRFGWSVGPEVFGILEQTALCLRIFGRIAFPVYCFLLVEGFLHTKNYGKYLRNLIVFALISEAPFDVAVTGALFEPQAQNIYWTLAVGLAGLHAMRWAERLEEGLRWFACGAVLLLAGAVGELLAVDYGYMGIALILILYLARNSRILLFSTVVLFSLCAMPLVYEIGSVPAGLAICLYNGRRGTIRHKMFYYWFYPAHLAVLVLLCALLLRRPLW